MIDFKEYLTEKTSDVIFHYTHLNNVLSMLEQDKIRLTYDGGTSAEETLSKKGKSYFFSAARSPLGSYGNDPGNSLYCMMKMSGRAFNQRFTSKAVDYWGPSMRDGGKNFEMEDRIYHTEPYIKNVKKYIMEIHIFIQDQKNLKYDWQALDDNQKRTLRRFMILAKKKKIPYWFYDDKNTWLTQNKRKSITVKPDETKTDKPEEFHTSFRGMRGSYTKRDIDVLKELYHKDKYEQLSKDAKKKAADLQYGYYKKDIVTSYKNTFHNSKKEMEQMGLDKIVRIMRKVKKQRIEDFIDYLADKWKDKIK